MRSEIDPSMHFTHRSFDQSGLHREIGVIFAGKGKIQSFDHDINNGFIQRTSRWESQVSL